jgi:predicted porin
MSGSYSVGGVAGSFNAGSTWSVASQYINGPFGIAAGLQRINNSTPGGGAWGTDSTTNSGGQSGVSALTNGYQTAAAQQRVAVTGGYAFTPALDISVTYSNVQYVPGINSKFTDEAVFNTFGTVLHYRAATAIDLAAGYSYTRATKANSIDSAAQYHQFNLSEAYNLSKRTTLYALQAFQERMARRWARPARATSSTLRQRLAMASRARRRHRLSSFPQGSVSFTGSDRATVRTAPRGWMADLRRGAK